MEEQKDPRDQNVDYFEPILYRNIKVIINNDKNNAKDWNTKKWIESVVIFKMWGGVTPQISSGQEQWC